MQTHPIVSFILSHFPGVNDVADLDPFMHCTQGPAHKLTRLVSKTVELQGCGRVTLEPADGSNSTEYCATKTIFISHMSNPSKNSPVLVKRLFSHILAAEDDKLLDQLYEERGVLRIPPNTNTFTRVSVIAENPNWLYLNASFIQTCMLISPEENLMNGILKIPEELCAVHLDREGSIIDHEGLERHFPISYYVAVPHGHILSYHLMVDDYWRRRKGIYAKEMNVRPRGGGPSFILYYLVADSCFAAIKKACIENWLTNKIDKRPLGDLGLEFNGSASVTATFSYFPYPGENVDLSKVAPVLHSGFPSFALTIRREYEEMKAKIGEENLKKRVQSSNTQMDTED